MANLHAGTCTLGMYHWDLLLMLLPTNGIVARVAASYELKVLLYALKPMLPCARWISGCCCFHAVESSMGLLTESAEHEAAASHISRTVGLLLGSMLPVQQSL